MLQPDKAQLMTAQTQVIFGPSEARAQALLKLGKVGSWSAHRPQTPAEQPGRRLLAELQGLGGAFSTSTSTTNLHHRHSRAYPAAVQFAKIRALELARPRNGLNH